tara:strand:+ start:881 stop:2185 length:1305 start_codon:yes stop_codon:yes gene_type:complete
MPKKSKELPDVQIRRLRHATNTSGDAVKVQHAVGGVSGLRLQCMPPVGRQKVGARSWILRVRVGVTRPEFGLGGYPDVPAQKARETARAIKEEIRSGIDPKAARAKAKALIVDAQRKALTVKQAVAEYVILRRGDYKTAKQIQKLNSQMDKYVIPYIGNMEVKDIERADLIAMLKNYYYKVPSTAIRVINHVEKIIQLAIINDKRKTANPAVWHKNLSLVFTDKEKIAPQESQPFLSYGELPEFMKALRDFNKPKGSKPEADCLAFAIHTVARMGEARLVEWSDIDLDAKVWTIQPSAVKSEDRLKSKKMWKIPLTSPAINILKAQPSYAKQRGRIFSKLDKTEIPDSYFGSNINAVLGYEGVAHGFRTTFKTWCQEHGVNEEASELSLKHVNNDATRAAYARSQLFDMRKKLLRDFSRYATTGKSIPKPKGYT